MTLRRLRPNWVRDDEEDWEVRIVDRGTLRYVEAGRTTDIPMEAGLRGEHGVVHVAPAEVGDETALRRIRTALEFLDVVLVLDDDGQQPGGAAWPRT